MCFALSRVAAAYTDAPSIELFVNSASQGVQNPINPQQGSRSYAQWGSVKYQDGNITVVARDRSGNVIASHTVSTPGEPVAIVLSLDAPNEVSGTGTSIMGDGQDVALVRASLVDRNGVVVNMANSSVTFSVLSGPGRVVGTHNGDPTSHENNHSPTHMAYHGLVRAVIMSTVNQAAPASERARLLQIDVDGNKRTRIVRPGSDEDAQAPSPIVVQATADGFAPAQISIGVSVDPSDTVLAVASRSAKPVVV